jgi:hypothetical protein
MSMWEEPGVEGVRDSAWWREWVPNDRNPGDPPDFTICATYSENNQLRCGTAPVCRVLFGCIHEHAAWQAVCATHLAMMKSIKGFCMFCKDVDGHTCDVGVMRETNLDGTERGGEVVQRPGMETEKKELGRLGMDAAKRARARRRRGVV